MLNYKDYLKWIIYKILSISKANIESNNNHN